MSTLYVSGIIRVFLQKREREIQREREKERKRERENR